MTAANAPGTEPARAPERVVLDATIVVTPDLDTGLALQLEAGRLTVHARLASEALHEPVYLIFRGYRDADPAALIELPISRAGESVSTALVGGLYACNLHANPRQSRDPDRTHHAHVVALRLTLAPTR